MFLFLSFLFATFQGLPLTKGLRMCWCLWLWSSRTSFTPWTHLHTSSDLLFWSFFLGSYKIRDGFLRFFLFFFLFGGIGYLYPAEERRIVFVHVMLHNILLAFRFMCYYSWLCIGFWWIEVRFHYCFCFFFFLFSFVILLFFPPPNFVHF